MKMKQLILAGCSVLVLSTGAALAGPCDTNGAADKDAGSGPARTGETTGMAGSTAEHPPTATMNRSTDSTAASSQDAQQQMQGQPTAAQQAEGVKGDQKTADKDC